MELSSTLKNEIFRPLTMIVIPGAFSIAPFVAVLNHHFPRFAEFEKTQANLFLISMLLAATAAGFVLEDIGSRIEDCWDKRLNRAQPGREEFWSEYLKLKVQDEYIGQRYLRTIYIRFKFELSMAPALLFFLSGLIWANCLIKIWSPWAMAGLSSAIIALIGYMLWESNHSADVLGTLHRSITKAVTK